MGSRNSHMDQPVRDWRGLEAKAAERGGKVSCRNVGGVAQGESRGCLHLQLVL